MRNATLVLLLGLATSTNVTAGDLTGFSSGIELRALGADGQNANTKPAPRQTETDGAGWWQNAKGPGLRLTYAGEFENAPDGVPAIGLLFTGSFAENGNFNEFLSVYRPDGSRVPGQWQRSASPHLLYFNVPAPGKYIIRVNAGLSASNSDVLTETLSGPVVVGNLQQEPD